MHKHYLGLFRRLVREQQRQHGQLRKATWNHKVIQIGNFITQSFILGLGFISKPIPPIISSTKSIIRKSAIGGTTIRMQQFVTAIPNPQTATEPRHVNNEPMTPNTMLSIATTVIRVFLSRQYPIPLCRFNNSSQFASRAQQIIPSGRTLRSFDQSGLQQPRPLTQFVSSGGRYNLMSSKNTRPEPPACGLCLSPNPIESLSMSVRSTPLSANALRSIDQCVQPLVRVAAGSS